VALAQRQLIDRQAAQAVPRTFQPRTNRPEQKRRAGTRRSVRRSERAVHAPVAHLLVRALTFALPALALLVLYIYGYMLMTGANYQGVKLRTMLRQQQAVEHLLDSRQIVLKTPATIKEWADKNHFAHRTAAPIVIESSSNGQRR
jgi:hypothetical protein